MAEEEEAIDKARAFFEAGAKVVHMSIEDDGRIAIDAELLERPGTFVTARTIHEVKRFVRGLRLDRKE